MILFVRSGGSDLEHGYAWRAREDCSVTSIQLFIERLRFLDDTSFSLLLERLALRNDGLLPPLLFMATGLASPRNDTAYARPRRNALALLVDEADEGFVRRVAASALRDSAAFEKGVASCIDDDS